MADTVATGPRPPDTRATTEFAGKPVAAAAREYAESQEAFVRWFKDHVQNVTGVIPIRPRLARQPNSCSICMEGHSLQPESIERNDPQAGPRKAAMMVGEKSPSAVSGGAGGQD